MLNLKCSVTYLCLIVTIHSENSNTDTTVVQRANDIPSSISPANITTLNIPPSYNMASNVNTSSVMAFNNTLIKANTTTKHYVLVGNRKTVLIVNSEALRTRVTSNAKNVESLLYEEYDTDGTKLYSVFMYNLDDVAKFFQHYLNVDICHVQC